MKTNFRTSNFLVTLVLICVLISCNRTNTKKFSKSYSLTEMDSVQLLNCLYSDHLLKDTFMIPNVKVDSIINGDTLQIIENMQVMEHKITFKSTYTVLENSEYPRYDQLKTSRLTIDATTFDLNLLKLQPEEGNYIGIPPTNFFQPANTEARYYNENGIKYLALSGNILGCNGWYCNGFYFIFFDLNNIKPELYIIDFRAAYPFTFQNIGIKPTLDNKWLVYQPLVNYNAEPIIGVSIQPLKLINGKAIPDSIHKPFVSSYNYEIGPDFPRIMALTNCK